MVRQLSVDTPGQGLHEITAQVARLVDAAGIEEGLCTLFVRHTSASLVIQENADPTAKSDLERWLKKLVPEGDPFYQHDTEGPDDMPAHIKAALTASSLSVPIQQHRLTLGQWQGIYLWEHRRRGSRREIVVHIGA
ncbi:MAG TPA: secondary thiamine-phosphate synthase enzyme YjbQ [Burkholderiales bacterium]|nr:secondary thiamine-phosphate synthase enzyme YjbQ [Burkholderiales bacterium]